MDVDFMKENYPSTSFFMTGGFFAECINRIKTTSEYEDLVKKVAAARGISEFSRDPSQFSLMERLNTDILKVMDSVLK